MNTVNNKRRQATKEKIEKAFMNFLQTKEISQISVSDICKTVGINRTTFYANYLDIYDLADTIKDSLENEVDKLYNNDMFNNCCIDYLKLFTHIKDNQIFYKTYFKLGYDSKHIVDLGLLKSEHIVFPKDEMEYHIEFHKAGLNAIIKKWLVDGCKESPEKMVSIIENEYSNRH